MVRVREEFACAASIVMRSWYEHPFSATLWPLGFREIKRALSPQAFEEVSQNGSHVKFTRLWREPPIQLLCRGNMKCRSAHSVVSSIKRTSILKTGTSSDAQGSPRTRFSPNSLITYK